MRKLLVVFAAALAATAAAPPKIVELPLTMHDGYGGMRTGMGGLSPDPTDPNNPWFKSRVRISRLPENLTEVQFGAVETDIYQSVYQNYLAGNVTREGYDDLQKSWNFDTSELSKTPVRTKIAFAFGLDANGARKFVLDANGNLDLSDDAMFSPIDMETVDGIANKDSLLQVRGVRARVEIFANGKISDVEIPVFVAYSAALNMFMANIGRYAMAEYKGQKIAVNSHGFGGDLAFRVPTVRLADAEYNKGEYIKIKGETLKILGVDMNKNALVLERTDVPADELYSSQTGFAAHPFSGEEFTSRAPISLENLRGKYVLLDFWAVWCVPCIREFPNLRALYGKTSRERFEIVGVVGDSGTDALTSAIEKHSVVWPQILSDEICKIYGVRGYPTTLLINPEGVVIAKDLRGDELEKRVLKLLGE